MEFLLSIISIILAVIFLFVGIFVLVMLLSEL